MLFYGSGYNCDHIHVGGAPRRIVKHCQDEPADGMIESFQRRFLLNCQTDAMKIVFRITGTCEKFDPQRADKPLALERSQTIIHKIAFLRRACTDESRR